VLARTRVSHDWRLSIERRNAAVFHFVSDGRPWLRIEDAEPIVSRRRSWQLFPPR
jgi:hypothetical protein